MKKSTSKKTTRRAPAKRKVKGWAHPHTLLGLGVIGSACAAVGAGIYKLATLS